MALDTGYRGSIVSMAGYRSKPGYGLKTNIKDGTTVTAAIPVTELFPANGRRVWLFLQNIGDTHGIQVYFANDHICYLYPHDSMTLDLDHPWTGSISAIGNTGDSTIVATELEITGPVF